MMSEYMPAGCGKTSRTHSTSIASVGLAALLCAVAVGSATAAEVERLPGTGELKAEGDLAAQMVDGIDRFLLRQTEAARDGRSKFWKRDFASPEAYARSVASNRARLRKIIGAVDPRVPFSAPRLIATVSQSAKIAEGDGYEVLAVRWPVLRGVDAEGLLLRPTAAKPLADVVALPDADQTPEMIAGLAPGVEPVAQFARRLAESGCRVLVPQLIDRGDEHSIVAGTRATNQPHREFIYRQAYEMGRHVIGYEVQKVLAAVDWFVGDAAEADPRIGVVGYGEGGLLALYSAALDERVDAALVSGYFDDRQRLWQEPIYRNVFSLLREFGDAELASLIAPRALVIEASRVPEVAGPPQQRASRSGAAPGRLETPSVDTVRQEVNRARSLVAGLSPPPRIELVTSGDGAGPPGTAESLERFLDALAPGAELAASAASPNVLARDLDNKGRLKRQFDQLSEYTQYRMRESEFVRREFWSKADTSSLEAWQKTTEPYRQYLYDEVIGRFDLPLSLPSPRTRKIYDEPKYVGYEVVLDVWPDVFAYGILLVPKDIQRGERRPVVVCQHGLEGRPQDVADPGRENPSYHQYACRLAERGFITYAPQNPYIGRDRFRTLQRKANPLGKTLFSVIVPQHQVTVDWLAALPFVDEERIAFYGLSYGGKTAMRVPPLVAGYCLSICSADFNEWIWKNVTTRHTYSYLGTGEYEMFEFDLGNTFNYAELAALIAPRPFMVERGHGDGVAPDEWVAYEFAKVRRRYAKLKIPDRAEIEFFDGPHTIHGVGTFDFLHRHLKWPKRRP